MFKASLVYKKQVPEQPGLLHRETLFQKPKRKRTLRCGPYSGLSEYPQYNHGSLIVEDRSGKLSQSKKALYYTTETGSGGQDDSPKTKESVRSQRTQTAPRHDRSSPTDPRAVFSSMGHSPFDGQMTIGKHRYLHYNS